MKYNFSAGRFLKPYMYNEYEYREARARLFKAFMGVLIIATLYGYIYIQVVYAASLIPLH